jgi:hypothetical protein
MLVASTHFAHRLRECRFGVALAVFNILFGFALGGVFGGLEDPLKADLAARAQAVSEPVYGGDAAKIKSVLDKSWVYYKRAHMHGGGIGAATLGLILLLSSLSRPSAMVRRVVASALGLGGLGYASFWLLAGRRAPGLGGTDAAKETLSWLAVPAAGLLIAGLFTVLVLLLVELFAPVRDSSS